MTVPRASVLVVHLLSILVSRVVPLLLWLLILWQFHQTVVLLAAGDNSLNPYLQVLASANRARSFAFLLGILGVAYGLQQRSLRLRAMRQLEHHLQAAGLK